MSTLVLEVERSQCASECSDDTPASRVQVYPRLARQVFSSASSCLCTLELRPLVCSCLTSTHVHPSRQSLMCMRSQMLTSRTHHAYSESHTLNTHRTHTRLHTHLSSHFALTRRTHMLSLSLSHAHTHTLSLVHTRTPSLLRSPLWHSVSLLVSLFLEWNKQAVHLSPYAIVHNEHYTVVLAAPTLVYVWQQDDRWRALFSEQHVFRLCAVSEGLFMCVCVCVCVCVCACVCMCLFGSTPLFLALERSSSLVSISLSLSLNPSGIPSRIWTPHLSNSCTLCTSLSLARSVRQF
jgi:hypothetical protein